MLKISTIDNYVFSYWLLRHFIAKHIARIIIVSKKAAPDYEHTVVITCHQHPY